MSQRTPIDLEQMGNELSVKCEWNGLEILQVAIAALTNANFHGEAEVLEQMYDALNVAPVDLAYKLDIREVQS